MIDHATATNGKLSLPSRNLNKRNIMKIAEWMTNEIKIQIRREMNFYSTTTDLWSSRRMNALIALTLHYLTEDFQMREFTLESSPVEGNHTSGMIQNILMTSFERWGLNVDKLSLMLRDGASNGKRACEDWGIKHMSCINHSLHLVVGPFLLFKRKNKDDGDDDAQVDGDDVFMDNEEDWGNDHCMEYIRNVVNDFRLATKFLKRSIKCKEMLERIQHLQHINRFLSVHLDVKTRWNSTYSMLRRMIKMQTTIDQFQVYLRSKRNFRSTKAKFPLLSEEKWAIVHGLCYIFTVFEKATRELGGQKYPTFVSGFPYLRMIRFKYPRVAIGARKWLSVCATSTPSERVFSISGLIDTPKRSNLSGKSMYDQVLIHNNWECLNPSLDRLRLVLK